MLAPAELAVEIANTVAFINANPTSVILTPRTRHLDGKGARFVNGQPKAPQTVKLIDQSTSRNTIPGKIQASDGVERLIDFILLAHPDADIDLYDFWVDGNGRTLEVAELYPSNQYEIRAAVVSRA
jgi:hypothetical protein